MSPDTLALSVPMTLSQNCTPLQVPETTLMPLPLDFSLTPR
jgi:hypothetical protein